MTAGWGDVVVRDARTGAILWTRYLLDVTVRAAAFDHAGERLAIGTSRGAILVLDASVGGVLREDRVPESPAITSLAWSVDGERLLAGTLDGRVLELRADDPDAEPVPWPDPEPAAVTHVATSPFARRYVTATSTSHRLKIHPWTGPGAGPVSCSGRPTDA